MKRNAMPDSQLTVPLKQLYLINDVEDIDVFLGLKMFISDNHYIFSFSENAQSVFKIINVNI